MTIDDKLYKQLKRRALDSGTSISSYVSDAIRYQILEDVEDLEAVQQRQDEPTYSFDALVREFKAEDLL